jgi:hypothetical protein
MFTIDLRAKGERSERGSGVLDDSWAAVEMDVEAMKCK